MKIKDIITEAESHDLYQKILKGNKPNKDNTIGKTLQKNLIDPVAHDIRHRTAKAIGSYGSENPKVAAAQGAARGLQWLGRSIAGVKDRDPGPISLSRAWRKATGADKYDYHRVEVTPDELKALKSLKRK